MGTQESRTRSWRPLLMPSIDRSPASVRLRSSPETSSVTGGGRVDCLSYIRVRLNGLPAEALRGVGQRVRALVSCSRRTGSTPSSSVEARTPPPAYGLWLVRLQSQRPFAYTP